MWSWIRQVFTRCFAESANGNASAEYEQRSLTECSAQKRCPNSSSFNEVSKCPRVSIIPASSPYIRILFAGECWTARFTVAPITFVRCRNDFSRSNVRYRMSVSRVNHRSAKRRKRTFIPRSLTADSRRIKCRSDATNTMLSFAANPSRRNSAIS